MTFHEKLTHLIREAYAMKETYKQEIDEAPGCEAEMHDALISLENVMFHLNKSLNTEDEDTAEKDHENHIRAESDQRRFV